MRIMEEEQKEKLTGRGGAGRNQGRKAKDQVVTQLVGVRIRKDYLKMIDENFTNRSDFFQKAVKEKLRREGLV
jgi:hypothetical protein